MTVKLDRTKMTTTLGKKFKLVPHLERVIQEGDFEWEYKYEPKKGDDGWHPSGDCTPTPFELWNKAMGYSEDTRSLPYKAFQVGHFWHAYLQHIVLEKLGFCGPDDIERRGTKVWGGSAELEWTKPYHWATGSGDIAPCVIPSHGKYIVDFKTMNGRDYAQAGMPNWVANKYEAQINIYMDFFNVDKGLILCIQKDSPHDMKEFEFERNQALIDAIYEKWRLVSLCLDEGVAPPEDFDIELPFTGPIL